MGPALRIRAALVDVGGTLWPNSWPHRVSDGEGRLARLQAALPHLGPDAASAIVRDIIDSSRDLNGGTTMITELIRVEANVLVHDCLERHGVEPLPPTVSAVRRAMRLPIEDRIFLLPGAIDLLKAIKDLGLRCVIASNTYWRDALDYAEDFAKQGLAPYIDAVVTSVDAGHLKPHRAV